MAKNIIIFLFVLIFFACTGMVAMCVEHSSPEKKQNTEKRFPRATQDVNDETIYPLYRIHDDKYYPERSSLKATLLSATMPGLGQAYADNYLKATLFLTAEIGVFSLASYNIARALYYRRHDTFGTGFYDERTTTFYTKEQVDSRMRDHTIRGSLFLITGIGLHIWNILDAKKTVETYNNRRISVQMQQSIHGTHVLIFTHRF